jgi:hypothetical protein
MTDKALPSAERSTQQAQLLAHIQAFVLKKA